MTCQCLAENRIGADIYLLLVTCKNVKWPTLKFFYWWRTIEAHSMILSLRINQLIVVQQIICDIFLYKVGITPLV
jgi:hypothetical protein